MPEPQSPKTFGATEVFEPRMTLTYRPLRRGRALIDSESKKMRVCSNDPRSLAFVSNRRSSP